MQYLASQSCQQVDWRHHFFRDIHHNTQHIHSEFPMACKGVKASKFLHRKSRAKVIEWMTKRALEEPEISP